MKKSATGLLAVFLNGDDSLRLEDKLTWEQEGEGVLKTIYLNGQFENPTTLTEIKNRLK
jgi:nicotinamide phosphoribosyltransferase